MSDVAHRLDAWVGSAGRLDASIRWQLEGVLHYPKLECRIVHSPHGFAVAEGRDGVIRG